ncbi:enoyl-CoA hydratase [Amycolatopsis acidicola]|uniref:Enoyl-CoA hydratase n=1 Tax=Amycolatopsis acidicola TaxID=2596893 RepID=A0A5N0UY05_9PSEU|nr:enoyl-CoA hydratase [Amycolatopsis acidicola]KAA9156188.1 enoyl-CoA hydratase [Amycolatopsis acidicola]
MLVRTEIADRVATVTLDRPEARNALSRALTHELWDAITAAGADPAVDVVILTGAGPAFCAGADLKEISGETPSTTAPRGPGQGPERDTNGLFRFLPVIEKPVLGAVNGPAVTGGLEVALQCTFLIASERARFADTHARLGVMPGAGASVLLARRIGLQRAIELSLTGNFLTAEEALHIGLVNHVVPHEELLPFARKLAGDIASGDQPGVRHLLAHYRRIANAATLDEAHLLEGMLAETWQQGTGQVGARRSEVMARGRAQTGSSPSTRSNDPVV